MKRGILSGLIKLLIISCILITAGAVDVFAAPDPTKYILYDITAGDPGIFENEYATADEIKEALTNSYISNPVTMYKVIIPEGTQSIGNAAFENCQNLKAVSIPNTVTTVGMRAFLGCMVLEEVIIPDSVTSIGTQAFFSCTAATNITLPNNPEFKEIKGNTFQNCTSITTIEIPNTVTTIRECAFSDCANLQSVTVPNGVTKIERAICYNCPKLSSVSLPNGVTTIGETAFYGDIALNAITLPSTLVSIEPSAFAGTGLTSIVIPEGVTTIENRAFQGTNSLSKITLPSTIQSIGELAFSVNAGGTGTLATVIAPQNIYDTYVNQPGSNIFSGRNVTHNTPPSPSPPPPPPPPPDDDHEDSYEPSEPAPVVVPTLTPPVVLMPFPPAPIETPEKQLAKSKAKAVTPDGEEVDAEEELSVKEEPEAEVADIEAASLADDTSSAESTLPGDAIAPLSGLGADTSGSDIIAVGFADGTEIIDVNEVFDTSNASAEEIVAEIVRLTKHLSQPGVLKKLARTLVSATIPKTPAAAVATSIPPVGLLAFLLLRRRGKWFGNYALAGGAFKIKSKIKKNASDLRHIQAVINESQERRESIETLRGVLKKSGAYSMLPLSMKMKFEVTTPLATETLPTLSAGENKMYSILEDYEYRDCKVKVIMFTDEKRPDVTLNFAFGRQNWNEDELFDISSVKIDFESI